MDQNLNTGARVAALRAGLLLLLLHHALCLWPQPLKYHPTSEIFSIDLSRFAINAPPTSPPLLLEAVARYDKLLRSDCNAKTCSEEHKKATNGELRTLQGLNITIASVSEALTENTDESYSLTVTNPFAVLKASTIFGALRGLETFLQEAWGESLVGSLCNPGDNGKHLLIRGQTVVDTPRFSHRGLLIDTARHYLPMEIIKTQLEAMEAAKLNVLHWHIVDDESFPYESNIMPELSKHGAFCKNLVYTAADIAEVVEFAHARGIRVIPEFDVPGHTASWGASHPEILAGCYDEAGRPLGELGPMNPAANITFAVLNTLLSEAGARFPDAYLHLGGDEVDARCWQSNPDINAYAASGGIADMEALQGHFMTRVVGLTAMIDKTPVVWQEAAAHPGSLPSHTVVQVWKWWDDTHESQNKAQANAHGAPLHRRVGAASRTAQPRLAMLDVGGGPSNPPKARAWIKAMKHSLKQGHRVILSAPWYLNLGTYASSDWERFYSVDPMEGLTKHTDRVLGGETCLWGEFADDSNAIPHTWPAAAAIAEVLWSPAPRPNTEDVEMRLRMFRAHLRHRGIMAGPVGRSVRLHVY